MVPMRKPTPLKLAIVASGHSQRAIAEMVGIDEPQFNHIVAGRRTPNLVRAIALSRLLDTPVEDLFPDAHGAAVSVAGAPETGSPETRKAA
jgi:DNA-binding XRE family transcriptional regulator